MTIVLREMGRSTGLVKVGESFAERLRRRARDGLESLVNRVGGEEFQGRLRSVAEGLPPGGVDAFGFSIEWGKYALAAVSVLYRQYFRVQTFGIEKVPAGRVLLIANHSGQIPIDGALIAAAMFHEARPARVVRGMVEKWSQTLPGVSTFFSRCGQVVGVPENARRLLEMNEALLVFPEGTKGISKPFTERYRLKDFGLGFMRLAIETQTPIVPVAVVGAEEQYINVGNLKSFARALGMPDFPIIPQILVPGGLLPLPTKYRLYFGSPLAFSGDPDDEDAAIEEKVETVRSTIQTMINRGLRDRQHIFW